MNIPLGILSATYQTDQGGVLALYRAFTIAGFRDNTGHLVQLRCLIDTGAALSVVPYSVWKHRNLQWTSVSKTLRDKSGSSALQWQGAPCELGETEVDLLGRRRLVAKFVVQSTAPIDVILGLNFLADNGFQLDIQTTGGSLSGRLIIP